jgi:hypothetical protein
MSAARHATTPSCFHNSQCCSTAFNPTKIWPTCLVKPEGILNPYGHSPAASRNWADTDATNRRFDRCGLHKKTSRRLLSLEPRSDTSNTQRQPSCQKTGENHVNHAQIARLQRQRDIRVSATRWALALLAEFHPQRTCFLSCDGDEMARIERVTRNKPN